MPSRGFRPHRELVKLAAIRLIQEYEDFDEIRIERERELETSVNLNIHFGGSFIRDELRASKRLHADLRGAMHVNSDKDNPKFNIVVVEAETNPNSGLLTDGDRLTAYKLLKQQHGDAFKLVLAIYKETPVRQRDVFDEIWEFDKPLKLKVEASQS